MQSYITGGLLCSPNTRDHDEQWKVGLFLPADSRFDIKHGDDHFRQDMKLRKECLDLLHRVERLKDLKVAGSVDTLSGNHQYSVTYNSNSCNESLFRKHIINTGHAQIDSREDHPRPSDDGLIEFFSFQGEPISYTKENIKRSVERPSWLEYATGNGHRIRPELSRERIKRIDCVNYADNGDYQNDLAERNMQATEEDDDQAIIRQKFSNADAYNGTSDYPKQKHFLVRRKAKLEEIQQLPKALIAAIDHDRHDLHTRKRKNINSSKGSSILEEDHQSGLQLVHLLLTCASAIAENNRDEAAETLSQLRTKVSMTGDSIQRVGAHLAEGLAARLFTKSSPFYKRIMKDPSPEERFAAFMTFYRVSPYYQFAHFTANQAIMEAFEGHDSVHVIDFDISYGFQWPSLIQSLSERENPPSRLRITGFGSNEQLLKKTGMRLSNFAASCRDNNNNNNNMSFQFHGFVEGSKEISAKNLAVKGADHDETVAVNLVLNLHRAGSSEKIYSRLKSIESLKPSLVTLVEQEANHNAPKFLLRFMETLHYYAALFDSLDECLPLQSAERLRIERVHFGNQMKNIIVCEENERRERHERLDVWKGRMERAGFMQIALSSRSVSQAKMLLQIRRPSTWRGGFSVYERDEGKALSLGWQDRQLITASVWQCKLKPQW